MTKPDIQNILNEYIEIVIPAMYEQKYHLILAKGGIDYPYLCEQSHLKHSLNGIFGLIEILKFIQLENLFVYGLNESIIRKALALITIHDEHKFKDYEKIGNSEFAIPLERLEKKYKTLNLIDFAGGLNPHIIRHGNVSKRSSHHGDLLSSDEEHGSLLWLLVRVGDTIASVTSASEAVVSLRNYLSDLIPDFAKKYQLYYHDLGDIRGVLTNLIHSTVTQYLRKQFGFQDIVYFATGTLYIGKKEINNFVRKYFIDNLVKNIIDNLQPSTEMAKSVAKDGVREKNYDFQDYIYKLSTIELLLEIILETTQTINKPDGKTINKDVQAIAKKKTTPNGWLDSFEDKYNVSLNESEDFHKRWFLVRRYLLYVDNLLKVLVPDLDQVSWFCELFEIYPNIKFNIQEEKQLFASGGLGKYVIIYGYHFLNGVDFKNRSAESCDFPRVIELLNQRIANAVSKIDDRAGKNKIIEKLGFREELGNYLQENLLLSFSSKVNLSDDSFSDYAITKKKGHSNQLCSICNRNSKYTQPLRTGILGDSGQSFSNRVLPAKKVPNNLRPWCPICHLEFILRKITGLSLPKGADYNKSRRIHLYVLPTFSFTAESIKLIGRVLKPLQEISALPIRDFGEESPDYLIFGLKIEVLILNGLRRLLMYLIVKPKELLKNLIM